MITYSYGLYDIETMNVVNVTRSFANVSFDRTKFCDIGLRSKKDGGIQYASKDVLSRNSKFFQTMLEEAEDSNDIIVELEGSTLSLKRLLLFFYKNIIDVVICTRDDINELIYLAHYLDSEDLLEVLRVNYEKNFEHYGPITIEQLDNLPPVANIYPHIRDLYVRQYTNDVNTQRIMKPDFTKVSKETLVMILDHEFSPKIIYNKKGQRYVIGKTMGARTSLAVVLEEKNDMIRLHYCGWHHDSDESVSGDLVKPLYKNGKFYNEETKKWDRDDAQHLFDNIFCFLANTKLLINAREALQDLDDVPDEFTTSKSYRQARTKLENL